MMKPCTRIARSSGVAIDTQWAAFGASSVGKETSRLFQPLLTTGMVWHRRRRGTVKFTPFASWRTTAISSSSTPPTEEGEEDVGCSGTRQRIRFSVAQPMKRTAMMKKADRRSEGVGLDTLAPCCKGVKGPSQRGILAQLAYLVNNQEIKNTAVKRCYSNSG